MQAISNTLRECFNKNGLEFVGLFVLGADNASVMTGVNRGVYTYLKFEDPHRILVRCVCSSLQQAVSRDNVHILQSMPFLSGSECLQPGKPTNIMVKNEIKCFRYEGGSDGDDPDGFITCVKF